MIEDYINERLHLNFMLGLHGAIFSCTCNATCFYFNFENIDTCENKHAQIIKNKIYNEIDAKERKTSKTLT